MVDVLETGTPAAGRAFIERVDLPFLPGGLPRVIAALGKGIWWAKQYQAYQAREADTSKSAELHGELPTIDASAWSEWRGGEVASPPRIPPVPAPAVTYQ